MFQAIKSQAENLKIYLDKVNQYIKKTRRETISCIRMRNTLVTHQILKDREIGISIGEVKINYSMC